MSENLYDLAYEFEKVIKASEEYQTLEAAYTELKNDGESKKLFDEFREMQLSMQQKQMEGVDIPQDDIAQATILIGDVQNNDRISKLLQAEERMGMVMTEINEIMMRPLESLYEQN